MLLVQHVAHEHNDLAAPSTRMPELVPCAGSASTVSATEIEEALDRLQATEGQEGGLQVVSAFLTPLIAWDPARKRFYTSSKLASLTPEAASKPGHMRARLQMIEQRTLRSEHFRTPALQAAAAAANKVRAVFMAWGMLACPTLVVECKQSTAMGPYSTSSLLRATTKPYMHVWRCSRLQRYDYSQMCLCCS